MNSRKARQADLPEVVLLERECPTAPQWGLAQLERDLASERCLLLVLEDGGRICGFASLLAVPPEAELTSIVVRAGCQGRGLGQALLGSVKKEAASLGCGKLSLEVSASNTSAMRFYEAAGFKSVGRRPKYYPDGSDAVLMDLAISKG